MFGILNYIKNRSRERALKNKRRASSGAFINLQDVKTIGFLYNVSSPNYEQEIKEIISTLDRTGVLYKGLAIETTKNILPPVESAESLPQEIEWLNNNSITHIENLYITWIGEAISDKKDNFFKQEFDLFISFNNTENFTMEHSIRDVKAKCVIGMHSYKDSSYTVVFEGENESTLSYTEYLKQIFHYLTIIKSARV